MNVQLLAVGVFLVHSGTLLVSDKCELAYSPQTRDDLELDWWYAGWYFHDCPMFSQRKTAVHQRLANLFLSNLFYIKVEAYEQLLE
jgi:hypothetical protein